jgi:hypothetical protein
MSIWCSWEPIRERDSGKPDWSVLSYRAGFSNWYPKRTEAKPASVDLAHIPGFVWREGLPKYRMDQDCDQPIAPYLRLGVEADNNLDPDVSAVAYTSAILTVRAAEKLRDDLNHWLGMERHRR